MTTLTSFQLKRFERLTLYRINEDNNVHAGPPRVEQGGTMTRGSWSSGRPLASLGSAEGP